MNASMYNGGPSDRQYDREGAPGETSGSNTNRKGRCLMTFSQSPTRPQTATSAEQILLKAGTQQERDSNIYPMELELAEGLVVTAVQLRLLTSDQIRANRSNKGATIGFMNIQLGGRVWINDFTLWHSARTNSTAILNPKYEGRDGKWYNKAYFLAEDLNRILEAAREAYKAAHQVETPETQSA